VYIAFQTTQNILKIKKKNSTSETKIK